MWHKIILLVLSCLWLQLGGLIGFAQAEPLKVIATHGILADVVGAVAGDRIELQTLIPVGADIHSFQPSPRDLTPLAEADVVFVNGAYFEESLLESVYGAAEGIPIVETSACIEIIPIGASGHHHDDDHADEDEHGHDDDHADEDEHGHDDDHDDEDEHGHDDDHDDEDEHGHDDDHADEDEHGHEDGHADEDEHGHEDDHDDEHGHAMETHCDEHEAELGAFIGDHEEHDHDSVLGRLEDIDCGGGHDHGAHAHEEGSCDPHVWWDPHNMMFWALMIRDTLSTLDPDMADGYAADAAAYIEELAALEADYILPLLAELPLEDRILITSHDSMGYLAATFDFQVVDTVIPGGSTNVEPSARDIANLIDLVKETGVPAIFGETIVNPSVMDAISSETGAELVVLYTDSLSVDGPAANYLDYMRYNIRAIVDALSM